MRKTQAIIVVSAFLVCNFLMASVRENEFGAGAVASSLAGAGMAHIKGPAAAHLNPANLGSCKKNTAEFGFRHISTHLDVDVTSGSPRNVNQLGTLFVFEFGGCFVPFENFGVGIWTSSSAIDPMSIAVTTPDTEFNFVRLDNSLRAPTMVASLGYAFVPQLSVGLGLSVAMHAHITQDVYAPLTDNGRTFSTQIGAKVKPKAAIIAGLSFTPWDIVGVSASFRTENSGQLVVPAKTQAAMVLPIPAIKVLLSSLFNYSPKQFGFGLFVKPFEFLTLMVDLDYSLWAEYPGPFINVIPDPSSSLSNGIPLPIQEPFAFNNTLVPKAGLEANLGDNFSARLGYRWHPSVINPNPLFSANLIDHDTHTISIGGGYRISGDTLGFHIDLFGAAHIMPKKEIQKDASQASLAYSFGGVLASTGINAGMDF